jgi:hypothetical protein
MYLTLLFVITFFMTSTTTGDIENDTCMIDSELLQIFEEISNKLPRKEFEDLIDDFTVYCLKDGNKPVYMVLIPEEEIKESLEKIKEQCYCLDDICGCCLEEKEIK